MGWLGGFWRLLKGAFRRFLDDDAMIFGAALAFYTALSLAPLVVLLLSATALVGEDLRDRFVQEVTTLIGPQGGQAVKIVAENAARRPDDGLLSAILGGAVLVFSATLVFAQLQLAMNRIWNVKAYPERGVWNWLRRRLFSLAMVVAIGFLLLVSLALSTLLDLLFPGIGVVWRIAHIAGTVAVLIVTFAAMFRFLPDVRIAWRDVWLGAAVTAGLFALGKHAIGQYLGYAGVGSSYGAAGSLVVLLVWVYYSSMIVFFGAELTQEHVLRSGRMIVLGPHAAPLGPARRGQAADVTKPDSHQR